MPTTIQQGFAYLASNVNITDLQEQAVSTRQEAVRSAVTDRMKVLDHFLTGSYRRSTMIAPLKEADLDIFIVLHPEYHQLGPAGLLDKVRAVLRERYPSTPAISRNGQAVTITFTDFKVDVVPGFHRQGGGYLIPDSTVPRWIETDPKKHVELWATHNKKHGGQLVPLIKMIKAWNRKHSELLRSFHLETMVVTVLTSVTISDFPSGARWVFDKARGLLGRPLLDPAGYGGDVGSYLNPAQQILVTARLKTAYENALAAEQLADAGRIREAYAHWRTIFDDYFPSYG